MNVPHKPGSVFNAVRGISGEFEIIRVLGAFGIAAYIIGAHAFVGYDVFWMKRAFNITEYCLAFPTGLGAVIGAVAGAATWKDKGVTSARITALTGAIPVAATSGPQVPLGDSPPVEKP